MDSSVQPCNFPPQSSNLQRILQMSDDFIESQLEVFLCKFFPFGDQFGKGKFFERIFHGESLSLFSRNDLGSDG